MQLVRGAIFGFIVQLILRVNGEDIDDSIRVNGEENGWRNAQE